MAMELHLEGLPECKAMIAQYQDPELANRMRRGVRAGAKPFQATLKAAAAAQPTGHLPASFAKRGTHVDEGGKKSRSGGVMAPSVTTRGGESHRDIIAAVYPDSPLFNIFEPGAQPHAIVPGIRYSNTRTYIRKRTGRRETRQGTVKASQSSVLAGPKGGSTWTQAGRKRKAAFFTTKQVAHPGMRARPILPTAFAEGVTAATDAVATVLFGGS